MNDFQAWFCEQDFYINMRFMYGDTLFIHTNGVYERLHVQMAWVTWQKFQKELEELSNKINRLINERDSRPKH